MVVVLSRPTSRVLPVESRAQLETGSECGRALQRTYVQTYVAVMKVTATRLRSELYQILDRVLETGEPVEVTRSQGTLVIKPLLSERRKKTRRAKPRSNPDLVVGDPDELVHFDWVKHWTPRL
jgi:antitoxin (DNA-binding transcriptional repressor) of toxin-antitoxin stability system